MAIISSIASWFLKKRIHEIELYKKYPHNVQRDCFENLIHTAEDTEWGLIYNYAEMKTVEEFRQRVPISSYHDLEPYFNRMRKGESDVLWPDIIEWYAKSSGTTNTKSKYIPVSEEAINDCHYKGGKDLLAVYHDAYPESEFLSGKTIGVAGSAEQDEDSSSYTGDLSAIIMSNLPIWAHISKAPKLRIVVMDEWEEKLEKIVEHTLDEDIRAISGVPSWMLVILRRALEVSGKKNIKELWPNFELVVHGGVSFTPYKKQFEEICGLGINYQEVYNASEGFIAMQDDFDRDDMLLMLDYGIFYEFIAIDELQKENPKAIGLREVEVGKTYALVISTNAGLWRYLIGDTVVFTSKKPYRIKINGRTKSFINAVGEELVVENADQAILHACNMTNSIVSEFTAAPIYFSDKEKAGHEWLIEFEKEPDDIDIFAEFLDNGLKMLNSDYEAKRYRNMILSEPMVHNLPTGSFMQWLSKNNRMGGQYKVPRLSNERHIVEEILNLVSS
ncbi:MAG: hypothetical protein DRI84_06275 [Bacteroidetes bacterium]|nr:MAG: hypothetical protein DRI84_06275 [Bacteroidota bacterium]